MVHVEMWVKGMGVLVSTWVLCVTGAELQGHHAPVLKTVQSSSTRWLTFPSAKAQHLQVQREIAAEGTKTTFEEVRRDDNLFFETYRTLLGLHPASEMILSEEHRSPSSSLVHRTYEQRIGGVRVFGGEFKLTLSSSKAASGISEISVLNAHGSPVGDGMLDTNFNGIDVTLFLQHDPKNGDVRRSIFNYFAAAQGDAPAIAPSDIELSNVHPVELIWYPGSKAVSLAYYIKGNIARESLIRFYAFIDANSMKVLKLVTMNEDGHVSKVKASQPALEVTSTSSSPFSSPITDADIYCYDQYAKDFNDDQDDNYYSQDPDRYSVHTLVFDTTSGDHMYPTADVEMNLLVDNTLYSKYLFNSLSGGEYQTWRKVQSDLNIEYNLSLANAYFDGEWGIHFGTGFITDDVVAHEWSHGYTQTGDDLVYERQSGSMNEGFSDIFGESVDILNADTDDTDIMRTASPASCTSTMNPRYGYGPDGGTDSGHRWCMAEEVSYYDWSNGDGTFRDMYKPECFFHPGATYSPYYACTTYYDHGGVHLNSGVFNHLFAVLVDGGEFVNGATVTTITPLGIVKTLNLYWRVHEELTATSDFNDFAVTMNEVCTLNIGETLYYPNVFNSTIYEVDGLTVADCDLVSEAVAASGMGSAESVCPNLDCSGERCEWARCPMASSGNYEVYYEDYDYHMGDRNARGTDGKIDPVCGDTTSNSYVRVFDQSHFHLDQFTLSCVQFGYIMLGQTTITIDVYIDVNGGEPDLDSLNLVASKDVTTVNAVNHMQVQTVSFDSPIKLQFNATNSSAQTLVVMMKTESMSEGFIAGGGQINANIDIDGMPVGQTFVGGSCLSDLQSSNSSLQWYVRLQGTSTYSADTSGEDAYDEAEIIALTVACAVIVILFILFSIYLMMKNREKMSRHIDLAEVEEVRQRASLSSAL